MCILELPSLFCPPFLFSRPYLQQRRTIENRQKRWEWGEWRARVESSSQVALALNWIMQISLFAYVILFQYSTNGTYILGKGFWMRSSLLPLLSICSKAFFSWVTVCCNFIFNCILTFLTLLFTITPGPPKCRFCLFLHLYLKTFKKKCVCDT